MDALADPVLMRFRAALDEVFGGRLKRAVLFGSRARGEARPESDYDVVVFLEPMEDRWVEFDRLADLRLRFLDETGAFFEALPFPPSALETPTPLMHEVRREGVEF